MNEYSFNKQKTLIKFHIKSITDVMVLNNIIEQASVMRNDPHHLHHYPTQSNERGKLKCIL